MRVAALIAVFGALLASCGGAFGETSAADAERAVFMPAQPFGSFDDADHNEIRARRVQATLPERRHRHWCGTTDGGEEARESEEYLFFRSPFWQPLRVTSRCASIEPSPLLEARAINDEGAWAAPRPALERCMRTHADRMYMTLALAIDEAKGTITASMIRDVKDDGLQACVADAVRDLCFEPKPIAADSPKEPKQSLVFFYRGGYGPGAPFERERRERLQSGQRLAAVSSKCPSQQVTPTAAPPTGDEVGAAFNEARPFINHCAIRAGRPMEPFEVAVNVHGPTGNVVGAAAVLAPRDATLDACIANVLAWMCFIPFEAPAKTTPYWSIRQQIPPAQ